MLSSMMSIRLPEYCSVFQLELSVIIEGVEWQDNQLKYTPTIKIPSDLYNVTMLLKKTYKR